MRLALLFHPKIANFGMWDFKNFFIRNTLPEGDFLNPCQGPDSIGRNWLEKPQQFWFEIPYTTACHI